MRGSVIRPVSNDELQQFRSFLKPILNASQPRKFENDVRVRGPEFMSFDEQLRRIIRTV